MNRREFFKFPAVLALVAAVPALPSFAKIAPEQPAQTEPPAIELIRELMAYDIRYDGYLMRWDISDGQNQCHVDYLITYEDVANLGREQFLIQKREEAIGQLKEYAVTHGMNMQKLIRMELPSGIEHARYV